MQRKRKKNAQHQKRSKDGAGGGGNGSGGRDKGAGDAGKWIKTPGNEYYNVVIEAMLYLRNLKSSIYINSVSIWSVYI